MKKRYLVILLFLGGLLLLGIIRSMQGSNALTRADGVLISVNCTVTKCTFIFKGSDTLVWIYLNENEWSPNYHFYGHGNYTQVSPNVKGEMITYLLELRNTQAIEGTVEVQ